jgi:hypothetical protein
MQNWMYLVFAVMAVVGVLIFWGWWASARDERRLQHHRRHNGRRAEAGPAAVLADAPAPAPAPEPHSQRRGLIW